MRTLIVGLLALLLGCVPEDPTAAPSTRPASTATAPATSHPARDAKGRIVRSEAAKRAFERMTGYPHGRPGYVVDHIVPLKRGGADEPNNMQWQTIEEAKAKDKIE